MKFRTVILLVILILVRTAAQGQTLTTGQISGTVTDPSGAVVPKAQVTVSNTNTGIKRTTESNFDGYYLVPLLDPGSYVVTIAAKSFETVSREGITVAVGRSALVDFRLRIGAEEIKMTISTVAPLIEPSNPNTTTTLSATELAAIPNPGNDLSYVATLAPGALMNTASTTRGGTGNVEFNGLPSVANNFTIDGLDANNAFFNTNAAGASNLQLGLNAIQEVSINTASYSADQGRQEAAQINYVTKSGTNSFHGNAYEIWNGPVMNARNFFNNLKGITKKPRSNVNEFGASVGGPILKNKLFFFADLEGIRIILPTTLTSTLPTPAYQTYVLQQLPLGGTDTFGDTLPPQPAEVPLYQNMFELIGSPSGGIPTATLGCTLNADGTPAQGNPPDGDGCATMKTFSAAPPVSETLFTLKVDYTLGSKDTFWFRFQVNNGSEVTPDPVSPIFNSVFSAPVRSGAAGWTHVFGTNLVNQFNPGISYNKNVSDIADPSKAHALSPITYQADILSTIGGSQSFLPFGSANTTWQLNDNLAWNHGKHALKFGENMRRVLISAFPVSTYVIPFESGFDLPQFTYGAAGLTSQSFPKSVGDRISLVNLDLYGMDTFRATSKLTVSIGLRAAWNSNPVSQHRTVSRLVGSFETISHDVNQSLNQVIIPNQEHPFASVPFLQWQPRAALAYELGPKTILRAGFGVFATTLENQLVTLLSANPPFNQTFSGGLFGNVGGIGIAPGVPNSAVDAAVAANQQFEAGFSGGALSCASPLSSPATCISPLGFDAFSGGRQEYPYSMQWSAGIERQFAKDFGLTVKYQGTRAVKMLYGVIGNSSQSWCQGCFASIPFQTPQDPRFGTVSLHNIGANSSYHALQVTGEKRMGHGLSFRLNYTYSHCLDTVSNGGSQQFNGGSVGGNLFPGNLMRDYGNCDYDVRHSLNGWYVYELPVHAKRAWLNNVIGGWQVSGTLFLRDGFPFSVLSQGINLRFSNGFPNQYANSVPGQDPYAKTSIPGVTLPGSIQWLNPNAFQSTIDRTTLTCFPTTDVQHCQDGNLGRNTLRAPGFRWTDLDIGKRFKVSEKIAFRFDAQFYNLFNHPNFFYPSLVRAGIPGKTATLRGFGTITQTVSPSTGLLGGRLGGDSSVRMIALRGRIEF